MFKDRLESQSTQDEGIDHTTLVKQYAALVDEYHKLGNLYQQLKKSKLDGDEGITTAYAGLTATLSDTKGLVRQLLERTYSTIETLLGSADPEISTLKDTVSKPSEPKEDGDVQLWTEELGVIDSTLLEAQKLLDSLPKHSSVLQG
eukprot:GHVU01229990.1.p1 GENE.GHVU01229990.1~~GHVU01229990.1.p1  ORF type:complete len:146 (+),score=18.99 GHVU01229990.1:3-440(+)